MFLVLKRYAFGWIAVGALAACVQEAKGQQECSHPYCGGCWRALAAPTRCSPLDLNLRPYYVPRTPAWGPHGYRYAFKATEPMCCPGSACQGTCGQGECSYPPETAAAFEPTEFESLGSIPNDSLLGGIATPQAR